MKELTATPEFRSHPMSLFQKKSNFNLQISLGDGSRLHESGQSTESGSTRTLFEPPIKEHAKLFSWFRWWLPEIFASIISVASLIAIVIVLRNYHGRVLDNVNLPYRLTLNGLLGLLSTINRVALIVPVGSAISQEVWLWLSDTRKTSNGYGRLHDLELSDAASRGALESLGFLFQVRRQRYVITISR